MNKEVIACNEEIFLDFSPLLEAVKGVLQSSKEISASGKQTEQRNARHPLKNIFSEVFEKENLRVNIRAEL